MMVALEPIFGLFSRRMLAHGRAAGAVLVRSLLRDDVALGAVGILLLFGDAGAADLHADADCTELAWPRSYRVPC
jgi:hypothetical protein